MAMYYYARKLSKGAPSSSSTQRRSKTPPPRMTVNGYIPSRPVPSHICNGPNSLPPPPPPCLLAGHNGLDPRGSFRFHSHSNDPPYQEPPPFCHNHPPPQYHQHHPNCETLQNFQEQHFCDGCGSKIRASSLNRRPTRQSSYESSCDPDDNLEFLPPPPLEKLSLDSDSEVQCRVHKSVISESPEVLSNSEAPQRKVLSERNELIFNGPQLSSGSWDALLKYLVPTEEQFPSEEFIFTFLLSARLFLSPHELLKRVFEEVTLAYQLNSSTDKEDDPDKNDANCSLLSGNGTGPGPPETDYHLSIISPSTSSSLSPSRHQQIKIGSPALIGSTFVTATGIASQVRDFNEELQFPVNLIPVLVQFLRLWTKLFPYDFRDERMMEFVRILARKSVDSDEEVREKVSQLLTPLHSRLAALEKYEEFLHRITTEASIGEPIAAPSVVTICPNPTTMAEQLTLVELQRFSFIGAEEFVQTLGKESLETGVRTCDCQNRKTKNLEAYVLWFQRLTYYVASEICKMSKKKSRVRVIEYWVGVAKECLTLRNFNSLMAILAGLNTFPVARLKKTWTKQLYTDLAEVAKTVDPQQNYAPYRKLYKAAVWQSNGGKGSRPSTPTPPNPTASCSKMLKTEYRILVPYFSLLMKDIYNLDAAHPFRLPNRHIDFEKCRELAKLVTEITSWQKVQCSFSQAQNIFNSVQASPIFNEQELIYASYICESPASSREKEQFKKLHKQNFQVPLIACNSSSENDT